MEAQVTAQSQPYRLRQEAQQANVRHGQEVRADIPNVRVSVTADRTPAHAGRFGWFGRGAADREATSSSVAHVESPGEIYFCNIGRLRVRELLTDAGDDAPLPSTVVVDGLRVSSPGHYDLVNVVVRANGDLRVILDADSRVERGARAPSGA